jgi:GNAT superfamily N-acetyltransferase
MLSAPVPLTDKHHIAKFDSGVAALNDWLNKRALANQVSGASRSYVVADETGHVIAFYALASGALALNEAPSGIKRNMPDPIPMAILGRLAVDRRFHGKGIGIALLQDAVLRVQQAASIMGIRGILVHAISEDARRFYERLGFAGSPTQPMTLVLSLPRA